MLACLKRLQHTKILYFPEKLEMSYAAYIVTQQDLGRHALNFPPNAIKERELVDLSRQTLK